MLETITMPKLYTNEDVAKILGVESATIRQVKSRKVIELDGMWQSDRDDLKKTTYWTEEGLAKLSEFIQTAEAKQFRSSALARRTAEAIAVDRSEQVNEIQYDDHVESSPRTSQQNTAYKTNEGRYSHLPEKIGGAIASQLIDDGAKERIDKAVVSGLLRELNIGDIDIEKLLG
jgi:hypothetical protein